MKTLQRILAVGLSLSMAIGLTACDEEGASVGVGAGDDPTATTGNAGIQTTTDPDENAGTDKDTQVVGTENYVPSGNAGTVKYLSYYDIHTDQKGIEQSLIFEGSQYGGTIEYINSGGSGAAYYEKLGALIAADDSPDIVLSDTFLYPGTVSMSMFEPLDSYIDYNKSAMWDSVKEYIEMYEYQGKHYYYPVKLTTSFAINYNKKTILENNLEDPYTLYKNGDWTWDKLREMLVSFCAMSADNMGYYATNTTITPLVATTGTVFIDAKPDGTILNNLNDPNVTRAMAFLEDLNRLGVANGSQIADWVSPQIWAQNSDKLLFLFMEPEWTYNAATAQVQNPSGIDDDIFDTVSDFSFVPFPRDPDADKYYQAIDTWGFCVAKGAKNIAGAVEMINCWRVYETDATLQAKRREDYCHPKPIYFTSGKYEGSQKWQMIWGEQEYDMWREMCDPQAFAFVKEDFFGISDEFQNTLTGAVTDAVLSGEVSWAQGSQAINGQIEGYLDQYRGLASKS